MKDINNTKIDRLQNEVNLLQKEVYLKFALPAGMGFEFSYTHFMFPASTGSNQYINSDNGSELRLLVRYPVLKWLAPGIYAGYQIEDFKTFKTQDKEYSNLLIGASFTTLLKRAPLSKTADINVLFQPEVAYAFEYENAEGLQVQYKFGIMVRSYRGFGFTLKLGQRFSNQYPLIRNGHLERDSISNFVISSGISLW